MSARRWAAPSIALLALVSSAVGIVNRFAYDDRYIIGQNVTLQHLATWWHVFAESYWPKSAGGDGYRPLTMLAFRLQWAIGRGIPLPFHAANILLYAAVSVLVFLLARRLLPFWAAWLTAALFAVHPVHVEAVANVVGQSELLVALFMLPAIILYLRDRLEGRLERRTVIEIAVLYAAACFAKEHGVVLPAILLTAELLFARDARPWRDRVRAMRPFFLLLALIGVAFIGVRARVLWDHSLGGFAPFVAFQVLHVGPGGRILTAIGVVPQWIRLLLWPARLGPDWGPPEIPIVVAPGLELLPGFLVLVGTLGLAVVLWRRRPVVSFGVAMLVFALLPSSNFILPAGIVLAERTLFLPSVGAMLAVGGALAWLADVVASSRWGRDVVMARGVAAIAAAAVLLLGTLKSIVQSRVWHDNNVLFAHSIETTPDSYRAHFMYGVWLFENHEKRLGERELLAALRLFPLDPNVPYALAERYREVGIWDGAARMYAAAFQMDSSFGMGHTAYGEVLLQLRRYGDARQQALIAMRNGGDVKRIRPLLRAADSALAVAARSPAGGSVVLAGQGGKVRHSLQKAAAKTAGGPAS